ncbi:MAG: hypothetical protein NTX49_04545 [Chlamydiae bacterium]|nr:hypothetical protein [Chlamydiota bacterium]
MTTTTLIPPRLPSTAPSSSYVTPPWINISSPWTTATEAIIGAGLALGIAYATTTPSSLLGHIVTPIAGSLLGAGAVAISKYAGHVFKKCSQSRGISRELRDLRIGPCHQIDTALDNTALHAETLQSAFRSIMALPEYRTWRDRNGFTDLEAFIALQGLWEEGTCFGQTQEFMKKIKASPNKPLNEIVKSVKIHDILVSQSKHHFDNSAGFASRPEYRSREEYILRQEQFSENLGRVVTGVPLERELECELTINRITADSIRQLLAPLARPSASNPSTAIISFRMQHGLTPEILTAIASGSEAERSKYLGAMRGHAIFIYRDCQNSASPIYLYNSAQPHDGCFAFRDLESCSKILYDLAKLGVSDESRDLDNIIVTLESNVKR